MPCSVCTHAPEVYSFGTGTDKVENHLKWTIHNQKPHSVPKKLSVYFKNLSTSHMEEFNIRSRMSNMSIKWGIEFPVDFLIFHKSEQGSSAL